MASIIGFIICWMLVYNALRGICVHRLEKSVATLREDIGTLYLVGKFQGDAIKEILGSEYEGFKYQWASNGVIELRVNYDRLNR